MTTELRHLLAAEARANGSMWAVWAVAMLLSFWWGGMSEVVLIVAPAFFVSTIFEPTLAEFRARAALPLSRRELGRARWWLGIGFPALSLTAAALLGDALLAATGAPDGTAWNTAAGVLAVWGAFGCFAVLHRWFPRRKFAIAVGMVALLPLLLPLLPLLPVLAGDDGVLFLDIEIAALLGFGLLAVLYTYLRPERLASPASAAAPRSSRYADGLLRPRLGLPRMSGWAALALPLTARLLIVGLAVAALAALADAATFDRDTTLVMIAGVGAFIGTLHLFLPLISAARVLGLLPLTAPALAIRLLLIALMPAAALLVAILIPYGLLAVPTGTPANLFLPLLFVMLSFQACWAPAIARGGGHYLGFVLTVPLTIAFALMIPYAGRQPLPAIEAWAATALPLAGAMWLGLALVVAAALIFACYRATVRALRAGRGRRSAAPLATA